MKRIGFLSTLVIAKILYFGLKTTKLSSGTAIIGKIVQKINPSFLSTCNSYINKKVNITGTNGKTTTSGLISHLIKADNYNLINNAKGANMLTGIINALAVSLNPFTKYDYSIIETDEGFLSRVYDQLESDYLLVTNLFRDQLDRFGELAYTKKLIQEAIDKKDNLTLFLNADDPLVASFQGGAKKIYYGVENVYYIDETLKSSEDIEENFSCACEKNLEYTKKFYAQLGHYHCECGFQRPEAKYKADIILHKDYSEIVLNGKKYKVPLVGLFNAYNALAAISLCLELGIQNIEKNINSFKVAFGRSEIKYLNNKKTVIQLIKNPIGANEVLKTVDKKSSILIAINDNYADGRDISWLWDTNFELLKEIDNKIILSGTRANDIALRLKYAGIKQENLVIIPDLVNAIKTVAQKATENITILTTYTALLKINKMKILKNKK